MKIVIEFERRKSKKTRKNKFSKNITKILYKQNNRNFEKKVRKELAKIKVYFSKKTLKKR